MRGRDDATVILTTPQGETFDEALTLELLDDLQDKGELILVCGHYKGIDERARELVVTREVSIGDYVLSGGELPALVIADALVRRIEGVLHNERFGGQRQLHRHRAAAGWIASGTPSRRSTAGWRCRRCCCPGTMRNIEKWRAEQAAEQNPRAAAGSGWIRDTGDAKDR